MGTWGYDTFENDSACDWKDELENSHDLSAVEAALDAVLADSEEYLDSDVGAPALAACEVIARLQGSGGQQDAYTEDVDRWVAAHPQVPPERLIRKAETVIERVTHKDSELFELWEDSGSLDHWLEKVESLRKRLRPGA